MEKEQEITVESALKREDAVLDHQSSLEENEGHAQSSHRGKQSFPEVGLFHESLRKLHERILLKSTFMLLGMSALVLGIFSIFWGSAFGQSNRIHNLNVLVVNYDEGVLGRSLVELTEKLGENPSNLGYQTVTPVEYGKQPDAMRGDILEELAWGAIVIQPNASERLFAAINESNFLSSDLVKFYFSEGRQTVVGSVMVPQIIALNETWISNFKPDWIHNLTQTLSSTVISDLLSSNPNFVTFPVSIGLVNVAPVFGDVSAAMLSSGLVFIIIVSFFQIPNFANINVTMLSKVPFLQYMFYRLALNIPFILVLSLSYSLISLAFQQDFTKHFGHRGFPIYWMINFLSMAALGGASDNVVAITMNFLPPALDFWLVFWVAFNSAGLGALELSPEVFKVERAFPLFNAQTAVRTVLFGTKNQLGKNFGILIGWCVVNWLVSFPILYTIKYLKRQKADGATAATSQPEI